MKRFFSLLWLRIREYFKHPAEDIRQARPIIPGRLYSNFGYICKAVQISSKEAAYLQQSQDLGALPACLLNDIKPADDYLSHVKQLHGITGGSDAPAKCNLCDFYKVGIPCPFYNTLEDGSVVCDTHKYIILKNQR